MNNFQKEVDERSSLTHSNKLELLLFTLAGADANGPSELYGINVFKVQEIVPMLELRAIAQSHPHML